MAFSCASALAEVMTQYEDLPLETRSGKTVKLRNLLMLSDSGLKSATVLLKSFTGSDNDADLTETLPKMRDLLLLVADDTTALKREMQDWPLAMYMNVIDEWQKVTAVGEAQGSES